MNIYRELSEIASAKYGLGLKDPIYYALAKLVEDPKFGLLHDMFNDDPADFDNYLDYYFSNETTCAVIANFMRMIWILNGRKAFYGPNEPVTPAPYVNVIGKDTLMYWVSMLGEELMRCGNANFSAFNAYGIIWTGDGLINGSKIRAAMYYILEILSKSNNEVYEEPTIIANSPFCFFGRDIESVRIYGTEDGIGYLNPDDNHYYIDVTVKDVFSQDGIDKVNESINVGSTKLGLGYFVDLEIPVGISFSHSLYEVKVMEGDKAINPEILLSYNALRDTTSANPEDYDYELYNNNTLARTLLYKGNDEALAVPDKFEGAPTRKLGPLTYYGKKIKKIYVIDGITTIE